MVDERRAARPCHFQRAVGHGARRALRRLANGPMGPPRHADRDRGDLRGIGGRRGAGVGSAEFHGVPLPRRDRHWREQCGRPSLYRRDRPDAHPRASGCTFPDDDRHRDPCRLRLELAHRRDRSRRGLALDAWRRGDPFVCLPRGQPRDPGESALAADPRRARGCCPRSPVGDRPRHGRIRRSPQSAPRWPRRHAA